MTGSQSAPVRYHLVRYTMPVSWLSSPTSIPRSPSQAGTAARRPPAATTNWASSRSPLTSRTPRTVVESPTSPAMVTPPRRVTAGSAATAVRSAHSKVLRRANRTRRSASPSRRSAKRSARSISTPPAATRVARTSGNRSRKVAVSRASRPWVCRTCGAPRRSTAKAVSGPSATVSSSRSSTMTRCPARPNPRATPRPATPPPTTTTGGPLTGGPPPALTGDPLTGDPLTGDSG